jgi:S-formylglutathione hydrolase FrmB
MRIVSRFLVVAAVTLILSSSLFANSRVDTVKFQSKLVNATLPYNVILPPDYVAAKTARYPVLYLLHGLTGHYTDWVGRTNIADYAVQYRIIVVTPEGNDSWYIENYETYILLELIPDVQQRYRTIEARDGRAIAGLSMGGYGAIKFGLKSPQTFALAASMSGAFGMTRFTDEQVPASWRESLKLFGPAGSQTRKANDLFELIGNVPASQITSLPYFYFDCGTEDSPLIFPYNRQLADMMVDRKIPHEYRELPGDHSWAYWDRQVQEILRLAGQKLAAVKLPKARGV